MYYPTCTVVPCVRVRVLHKVTTAACIRLGWSVIRVCSKLMVGEKSIMAERHTVRMTNEPSIVFAEQLIESKHYELATRCL